MAQGWDRVASETASRQERQQQFEASSKPRVWLKEGESMVARFCEQGPDIFNFVRHPYQVPTKKGPQTRWFTCLNDDGSGTSCPGCSEGLDAKVRGVYNVIQRQRPIFRKGQDGKAVRGGDNQFIVDGHEDAVVIWEIGSITAENLRQMDADYDGLMSRDFKISRTSGSSFQPYVFTPADVNSGMVQMSPADLELLKAKHDLDEAYAAPSFAEAAKIAAGQAGQAQAQQPSQQPQQEQPAAAGNPFLGAQQ